MCRSERAALSVLAAACFSAAACTSDCPALCGEGMICVDGECVSACNPPCPTGWRCVVETSGCQRIGDVSADADADDGAPDAADADADADADAEADADADADADAGRPVVDLVFLAENTGSFGPERANLPSTIATFLDAYRLGGRYDWDLGAAVAHFGDFPVEPYGRSPTDVVFGVIRSLTTDLADAAAGVPSIPALNGNDLPDGGLVALYLLATGSEMPPFWSGPTCGGGDGAVCFRPGSRRVVMVFTDSTFHSGPPDGSVDPYDPARLGCLAPPAYPAAVAALRAAGVRVIVVNTSTDVRARGQYEALAWDTGSVSAGGPAVYDVNMSAGPADLAFLLDVVAALIL